MLKVFKHATKFLITHLTQLKRFHFKHYSLVLYKKLQYQQYVINMQRVNIDWQR